MDVSNALARAITYTPILRAVTARDELKLWDLLEDLDRDTILGLAHTLPPQDRGYLLAAYAVSNYIDA